MSRTRFLSGKIHLFNYIKSLKIAFGGFLFILFLPLICAGNDSRAVVINEICWMGNDISYSNEWIELYNNTNSLVNVEGWKLIAGDGTPKVELRGEIGPNNFYLLERSDDEAVVGIAADLICKGSLDNNGEVLKLIDKNNNLIDEVDCSGGWFAGNNKTKQTMERKFPNLPGPNPDNWQTSQNPNGTPKNFNSRGISSISDEQISTGNLKGESLQKELDTPLKIQHSGIIFSEILPSPEGADAENEYIEIFNQNDFEISLSGWQIKDVEGKTKVYIFPPQAKIAGREFLTLYRDKTKITLNNNGDGLRLVTPEGMLIDEIYYSKASTGESLNKTENGWLWSSNLTPGAKNSVDEGSKMAKEEKESGDSIGQEEIVAGLPAILLKNFPNKSSSQRFLSVFLLAFTLAIFSAVFVLILKKQLNRPR